MTGTAEPSPGDLSVDTVTGASLSGILPGLAALRIEVFRDFPYLYDGDLAYEERYLAAFADGAGAMAVTVHDGDRLVGAATGAPLAEHDEAFAAPLRAVGIDPADCFYCAESVLLPAWRGRGLGHVFFDRREAEARRLGLARSVFCAVIRSSDHPMRPAGYRPLDPFWRARGYAPLQGAVAEFTWRDTGAGADSVKPMQVWHRAL